jgi:RimJ/RimL family protein N-acetyltransferase
MAEPQIQYRPARAMDADQVYRLLCSAAEEEGVLLEGPEEISPEEIRTRIRNSTNRRNRFFQVATEEERVVGFAALESSPLRSLAHLRFLTLTVEHHHRRKGIGGTLARAAVDWARRTAGVQKLEAQLRDNNAAGLHLLLSLGFSLEGRLKRHVLLPDGREIDDLTMALFVDGQPNP